METINNSEIMTANHLYNDVYSQEPRARNTMTHIYSHYKCQNLFILMNMLTGN